jgi:hypothetical protein
VRLLVGRLLAKADVSTASGALPYSVVLPLESAKPEACPGSLAKEVRHALGGGVSVVEAAIELILRLVQERICGNHPAMADTEMG